MIETIEREGLRWYLSFSGNSLSSVLHAVEAGLGLSVLPVSAVGKHQVKQFSLFGKVRPMTLSIYAWEQDAPTAELLNAIIHILSAERS